MPTPPEYRFVARVYTRFSDIPPEADGLLDDRGGLWILTTDGWRSGGSAGWPLTTLTDRGPWTVTHVRPVPGPLLVDTPKPNTWRVMYPDGTRRHHRGTPDRIREIHAWTVQHLTELDAILTHLETHP
jgi:hypothetical protein